MKTDQTFLIDFPLDALVIITGLSINYVLILHSGNIEGRIHKKKFNTHFLGGYYVMFWLLCIPDNMKREKVFPYHNL